MQSTRQAGTLWLVSELGSLFSLSIDPLATLEALRGSGVSLEVLGPDDEWRQIIITPSLSDAASPVARLTLTLKTRQLDQLYFRKIVPDLLMRVSQIVTDEVGRQHALESLIPHFGACIELVAEPGFAQHDDFLKSMTLVARLIEGVFIIPAGFLDAESREILMSNGTSHPDARLPAIPEWPVLVSEPIERRYLGHGDAGQSITIPATEVFDPHDEPEVATPVARRVAERMYAMLTVAYRGVLDINSERSNREAYLTRLADWFWTLNVGHELEEHERHILDQPLGAIGHDAAMTISQQLEAVVVLAWALELVELPEPDQLVQAKRLADVLGLFREDTRYVIDSAELRHDHELRTAADRIMAVHWRLREFAVNPRAVDFQRMCDESWFGPIDPGSIPLLKGDLAIGGIPLVSTDPAIVKRVFASIQHRHRAINWLCGHHAVFSQVDIST